MLLSQTLIIPLTSQKPRSGVLETDLSSSKAANSNCNSQQQQQSLEGIEKRRNKDLRRLACLLAAVNSREIHKPTLMGGGGGGVKSVAPALSRLTALLLQKRSCASSTATTTTSGGSRSTSPVAPPPLVVVSEETHTFSYINILPNTFTGEKYTRQLTPWESSPLAVN